MTAPGKGATRSLTIWYPREIVIRFPLGRGTITPYPDRIKEPQVHDPSDSAGDQILPHVRRGVAEPHRGHSPPPRHPQEPRRYGAAARPTAGNRAPGRRYDPCHHYQAQPDVYHALRPRGYPPAHLLAR